MLLNLLRFIRSITLSRKDYYTRSVLLLLFIFSCNFSTAGQKPVFAHIIIANILFSFNFI